MTRGLETATKIIPASARHRVATAKFLNLLGMFYLSAAVIIHNSS
jgi:hypothetical protein